MAEKEMLLGWSEAQGLLAQFNVHLSGESVNQAGLADTAAKYGFPLVLKGYSAYNTHKKEHGLVKLGISSQKELTVAYHELEQQMGDWPGTHEIVLQPTAPTGLEFVLGARQDATFGPVIMFGLGGTLVEVFNDVVFAMAPLDLEAALAMLERWPRKKLLDGYRGFPAVDRHELAGLMVNLSKLISGHREIREVDLNPVIAGPGELILIDVRVER